MARVLLLGGLDPSGGAGVTHDAAVVALRGGEPLPLAVSLTVQGLSGFVRAEPVPETLLTEQLDAVLADGPVGAVKVGFVGDVDVLRRTAALLARLDGHVPVVVDPVLAATAGGMGASDALAAAYLERLVPACALVTPNTPELQRLVRGDPAALLGAGAGAVLHKGGHGDGAEAIDELWSPGAAPRRFARPRLACGPVRGTGCALASAAALELARGRDVVTACRTAGDWLASVLARVRPRPDGRPRLLPLSGA